MAHGNETHRMAGMTARTAICGVMFAVAVSASMVTAGARLGDGGNLATSIVMIAAMTGLLLVGLFAAWNTGRASVPPGNRYVDATVTGHGPDRGRPEEPVTA